MNSQPSSPLRLRRRFTIPISRRASLFAVSVAMLLSGQSAQAATSTWAGSDGNWSSNGSPGWNATGVPNAVGAVALFNTTGTTTQDIAAGITVGAIRFTGNPAAGTRSIANTPTSGAGGITLNNGGATNSFGTSGALIENATTGTGDILNFGGTGTAGITLADNLTIANTGSNTSASGSISFSTGTGAAFHGTGNVTYSNVSNNIGAGEIVNNATSDYTGTTLIQKGALLFSNSTGTGTATLFGLTSNVVTLGQSGSGSATLESSSSITLANNIIVAATAAGETRVLGSTSTSTSANSTFSGTILLNGDVSLISVKGTGAAVAYTNVISGTGNLTVTGTGTTQLTGANTYSGATTVGSGTMQVSGAAGSIASSSSLTISGSGVASTGANASGLFILDKTGATAVDSLNNTGAINLSTGGEFSLKNSTNGNSTETVGNIVFGPGSSTITVTAPTTGIVTLASTGLSRTGSGTGLLRGTNFAQSSSTSDGRITVATAPSGADFVGTNTINSGAMSDSTQGLKIVPWLLGDITPTATGTRFVTYDTTVGFRALLQNETTTLAAGSTTAVAPVNAVAFNGTVSTANLTVNSLIFNTASQTLDGSGALTVNSGAVAATAASDVIGSGWSSLSLLNGEGIIQVITGSTLTINTGISVTGTGSGGLTKGGAGNLILNGVNTYTGPTTINQGNLTISGAGQLNSGNYSGAISSLGGGTFTYGSSADQILSGGISLGTGSLIKSGTSNLTISGVAASYTGSTTINGGTLKYGIAQATPAASAVTINATTASGSATLDLAGFNGTVNGLTFGGVGAGANAVNSVTTGAGTLTLGPGSLLNYNATNNPGTATISGLLDLGTTIHFLDIAHVTGSTSDLTISALISGTGTFRRGGTALGVGTDVGILALTNQGNTFGLGSSFSAEKGTVNFANLANAGLASSMGESSSITIDGAGIIQYTASNGAQSTDRPITLGGGGGAIDASGSTTADALTFKGAVTGGATRTFTLTGSNTGANTVSGAISGTGTNVAKTGTGTWILSGANTYTGTTTVSAGTLTVDSAGTTTARLGSTTGVTITGGMLLLANSSGTLSTNRINNAATLTLNGGTLNTGGLSEGVATGLAAATTGLGALTLSSTSTLDFGLNHPGSSQLAFANSSAALWSGTLNLIDFTPGTDELNFASSTGLTSTQLAEISLDGFAATGLDSFGDVLFTPVPEPSTVVVPVLVVGFFLWRKRSRLLRVLNAA